MLKQYLSHQNKIYLSIALKIKVLVYHADFDMDTYHKRISGQG